MSGFVPLNPTYDPTAIVGWVERSESQRSRWLGTVLPEPANTYEQRQPWTVNPPQAGKP